MAIKNERLLLNGQGIIRETIYRGKIKTALVERIKEIKIAVEKETDSKFNHCLVIH